MKDDAVQLIIGSVSFAVAELQLIPELCCVLRICLCVDLHFLWVRDLLSPDGRSRDEVLATSCVAFNMPTSVPFVVVSCAVFGPLWCLCWLADHFRSGEYFFGLVLLSDVGILLSGLLFLALNDFVLPIFLPYFILDGDTLGLHLNIVLCFQ